MQQTCKSSEIVNDPMAALSCLRTAFVAADTLSDPRSRQLYNQFGPEGMKQHRGAQAGQGNARDAWDEFKPFTKENKRTKARAASQAGASVDGDFGDSSNDEG